MKHMLIEYIMIAESTKQEMVAKVTELKEIHLGRCSAIS